MAKDRLDFLNDDDGNFTVVNGDFVIAPSSEQEAKSILRANKGDYSHYPLVGCNLQNYQNSTTNKAEVMRVIKQQIESSGLQWDDVSVIFEAND